MGRVWQGCARLRRLGGRVGPYLLLEMLLPGGTLFALLLYGYRRWKAAGGRITLAWRFAPLTVMKDAR